MFVRSTDGGNTWSQPIQVNDDPTQIQAQWLAALSVSPSGRIDAAWLDTRDAWPGTDSSALFYSYSYDGGVTWSPNERLSPLFDPHVGYPVQQKMGDYFDMLSDSGSAYLAWANTLNGEEDVYFSVITPAVSTGISSNSGVVDLLVFPNPSDGIFTVKSSHEVAVEVYNVLGEKVVADLNAQVEKTIDLSMLRSGIYYLKAKDAQGREQVRKITRY
jgi:hypothetical protein